MRDKTSTSTLNHSIVSSFKQGYNEVKVTVEHNRYFCLVFCLLLISFYYSDVLIIPHLSIFSPLPRFTSELRRCYPSSTCRSSDFTIQNTRSFCLCREARGTDKGARESWDQSSESLAVILFPLGYCTGCWHTSHRFSTRNS